MARQSVYDMSFGRVYEALIEKAERKGRTRDEVLELTAWLTGYSPDAIVMLMESELTYGDFFTQAPQPHPARKLIKGRVCGVRIEEIQEPLMQEIRYLDKLVDDLAKGKAIDKILPTL